MRKSLLLGRLGRDQVSGLFMVGIFVAIRGVVKQRLQAFRQVGSERKVWGVNHQVDEGDAPVRMIEDLDLDSVGGKELLDA